MRRVGIRAYGQAAKIISPLHQLIKIRTEGRLNGRHLAEKDPASRSINRNPLALGDDFTVNAELLLAVIDFQSRRAADACLAHAARDYGRMAGHAAARGHDRPRRDPAMRIAWTGF